MNLRLKCRSGTIPVLETDTTLQYAVALAGPEQDLEAFNRDGQDHLEYLLCTQTVDLTHDRISHHHDWVSVDWIAQVLFGAQPQVALWIG